MCTEQEKEQAHRKLWNTIEEGVNEAVNVLGPAHVTYMGIMYFTLVARETAPDHEEAIELIAGVVKETMADEKIIAEVTEHGYH